MCVGIIHKIRTQKYFGSDKRVDISYDLFWFILNKFNIQIGVYFPLDFYL